MFCKKCGAPIKANDAFCTGCGEKIEKENLGELAKIVVTREKKVMGFAISFPVYVDGVQIGILGNGKSLETEVTKGVHEVTFNCVEKTVKQEVDLTDSNEVEVTCKASMGLIAAIAHVTNVEYK